MSWECSSGDGAVSVEFTLRKDRRDKTVVFSGDPHSLVESDGEQLKSII